MRKAAEADAEECALRRYIGEGWPPNVRQVPTLVRPYWNFRELLVMQDGIIYKGDQIVVPLSLRADYLSRLHASHMGCESTLRRAREVVYWLNMAAECL